MNASVGALLRIARASVGGIVASALLVGCGVDTGAGESVERRTELTIGIGQLTPSVDPHVDSASTSRLALHHVYDRLVVPDFNGGWQPSVATQWETNDEGTELTFTLRDDVTFTNGERLDAEDVKYSLDRIMDPENEAYSLGTMTAKFSGAEVIDATHVKFFVKNRDVTAMSALATFTILPMEHARVTGMGLRGEGIGSGPMMIESFVPNDHLTLVPNPNYWGENPVKELTKVTFLSLPDEAARRAALDSGRADIVFPLSPDTWSALEESAIAEPYHSLLGQYQNLFLGKYDQDTPLKDVRVRQAVNYAIDKELIVNSILKGTSEVPSQMVPKTSPMYNQELQPWPYDPGRAKQLLAEAGYPDGFSVEMESTAGRTPADREVAAAIVQMLKDVGIEVEWSVLPATEWLTKFINGNGAPLFLLNTSIEPSMMAEASFTQWTTDSFTHVMSDREYDAAVAEMLSIQDDAERSVAVKRLSEMILEKQPVVMLYQVPMLYGINKNVKGFEGHPDMSFDLHTVRIGG